MPISVDMHKRTEPITVTLSSLMSIPSYINSSINLSKDYPGIPGNHVFLKPTLP